MTKSELITYLSEENPHLYQSDVERIVTKSFGIEIENFGAPGYTASQRSIFIIEEDGSIGYIWIAENPGVEPNYSEIFDYVES